MRRNADRPQDGAEREAGRQLAHRDPPPVAQADLAASAIARMMSEVACEPELPPELMISGMNSASTTARPISCSKWPIAVAVSISPRKSAREPAGALADHLAQADLHVRLVERLHAAELLHVLRLLADQGVDHVVHRDDAEHPAAVVQHRDGEQVVLGDQPGHVLPVRQRPDGDRAAPHRQRVHPPARVGQHDLPQRHHGDAAAGPAGSARRSRTPSPWPVPPR